MGWIDVSEFEEESDDEVTLLCLKIFEDNYYGDNSSTVLIDSNPSYDELMVLKN